MSDPTRLPRYFIFGLILLVTGAVFWKFNLPLFEAINGFWDGRLVLPMLFFSAMADGYFIIMISAAAYPARRGHFWTFLVAYLLVTISVQGLKSFFHAGRPMSHFPADQIFQAGEVLRFRSFPSGHSAAAMVLARYLAEGASRKMQYFFIALGLLAALSRVYIGAHFPVDIAAGAGIGFFLTHGVFLVAERRNSKANRPEYKKNRLLISLAGLFSAALYLMVAPDSYAPASPAVNIVAVCFLAYFAADTGREFFRIYKSNETA